MIIIPIFEDSKFPFKVKKHNDGMFMHYEFYEDKTLIGAIIFKLKRGWKQTHIDIQEKYQGKGYAVQFLKYVIQKEKYLSIQSGRIINPQVYKVIEKLKADSNIETIHIEKYDEWVFSNKEISREELLKKFDIND
jgi:GNAT superfamily N-acetyltransferase